MTQRECVQVGFTMYVLAANGAITGINACIVPRALKRTEDVDERYTFWKAAWLKALEAWGEKSHKSVHLVPMGVRVCTWNVGETRPGRDSLQHILGVHPGTERCVFFSFSVHFRPFWPNFFIPFRAFQLSPSPPVSQEQGFLRTS